MDQVRSLGRGEVHLWVARPAALRDPSFLEEAEGLLATEEARRRSSFVFERHRHEYLVTRALVRNVLSLYAEVAPRAWVFRVGPYGRPEIDAPFPRPRFNLSNHPSMVVCAVAEDLEIGVDVEPIDRGPSIVEIADTVFAPSELAALATLPEEARADRAVTLWTLKEAYIKARGMGLALPLARFAFDFPDQERTPTIAFEAPIEDAPERWWFSIRDLEGHRVALAVPSGETAPPVSVFSWPRGS